MHPQVGPTHIPNSLTRTQQATKKALLRYALPVTETGEISLMFSTLPDYEVLAYAALGNAGSRRWRAVDVSPIAHWFLLTMASSDGGETRIKTVLLARDIDLLGVLEPPPAARPVAL